MSRSEQSASGEPDRGLRKLLLVEGLGLLALVLATWPVWVGGTEFPQVPMLSGLTSVPRWVDVALISAAGAGVVLLIRREGARWFWAWIAVVFLALVLLNQHRLQVWVIHLIASGLILSWSIRGRARSRLQWFVISLYAWSALSKLDVGFVEGPGRMLWSGLLRAGQLDAALIPDAVNRFAPWMMPLGELAAALALGFSSTRRLGLWLSGAMHGCLLLAVGPLGLGHEAGVQLWNLVFLAQNFLLFVPGQASGAESFPSGLPDKLVAVLSGVLMLMPAFQPWGYWDVWPSWAVYSTRGGWTTVFVHQEDVARMPTGVQPFVGSPLPLSDWRPVDIDAWSLRTLRCPVYPQPRFRLAVAAELSRAGRIHVERRSPPNRWTGRSDVRSVELTGGTLPREVASEFWINTASRRSPQQAD